MEFKTLNKKGFVIDARILLVMMIALLFYLAYKALKLKYFS